MRAFFLLFSVIIFYVPFFFSLLSVFCLLFRLFLSCFLFPLFSFLNSSTRWRQDLAKLFLLFLLFYRNTTTTTTTTETSSICFDRELIARECTSLTVAPISGACVLRKNAEERRLFWGDYVTNTPRPSKARQERTVCRLVAFNSRVGHERRTNMRHSFLEP